MRKRENEDGGEKRISSEASFLCIAGIKIERSFAGRIRIPVSRSFSSYAACGSLFSLSHTHPLFHARETTVISRAPAQ